MLQGEECSKEDRRLTLLTALTLPLRACRDDTPASPKQRQSAPTHIIFTALKWKRKDAENVTLLHAAAAQLLHCYHETQASSAVCTPDTLSGMLGHCSSDMQTSIHAWMQRLPIIAVVIQSGVPRQVMLSLSAEHAWLV